MLILCCRALHRYSRSSIVLFGPDGCDATYPLVANRWSLGVGTHERPLSGVFGGSRKVGKAARAIHVGNLAGPGAAQKKKW
jgi:hypothetical protein